MHQLLNDVCICSLGVRCQGGWVKHGCCGWTLPCSCSLWPQMGCPHRLIWSLCCCLMPFLLIGRLSVAALSFALTDHVFVPRSLGAGVLRAIVVGWRFTLGQVILLRLWWGPRFEMLAKCRGLTLILRGGVAHCIATWAHSLWAITLVVLEVAGCVWWGLHGPGWASCYCLRLV